MENIDIDIDKDNLKNIDIDIDIDMAILENIYIDIDKGILQNIDIDKISYRLGFGISNTPRAYSLTEERITEKKLDQGALMRGREAGKQAGECWRDLVQVFEAWQKCEMFKAGCKLNSSGLLDAAMLQEQKY